MSEEVKKTKVSAFREGLILQKHNINNKLSNHAAVIYDHGLKLIKLEDGLRRIDHKIELKESQIFRNMSMKYQNVKPPITPTRINHEVKVHAEVVELKDKRLDILSAIGLAKLKKTVLEENTKMMQTYSGNVREEKNASSSKKL